MQHQESYFIDTLGIPAEIVAQTLEIQHEKGGDLLRLLMRQESVDEIDLLSKLGHKLVMEFNIALPSERNTNLTALLPISFLKKHLMVPVILHDDAFIAINDPFNFQPLDDLRRILKINGARPVLCPQATIVSAINFAYDMTQNTAEEEIGRASCRERV